MYLIRTSKHHIKYNYVNLRSTHSTIRRTSSIFLIVISAPHFMQFDQRSQSYKFEKEQVVRWQIMYMAVSQAKWKQGSS